MLTTEPKEAVEAARNVQAAYEEDGGSNLDAHIDGFMSGVEAVLARPGVDRDAYLSELVSSLEQDERSGQGSGSEVMSALVAKLKSVRKGA
ncbi:hypothetical protein ACFQI3_05705 [Hansschlegelia quercus]|uniref:Uncharacterized protein n=1 Tax=Hansschlegelia quercus TaxID=2528245 RepID=A0A4Q9GLK6_9HYPH|nr:hypothetical protein [Hansschlegelia quercus]TBN53935.1 hypothetical protein EYR15_09140 [Hansschlegelia quercus]